MLLCCSVIHAFVLVHFTVHFQALADIKLTGEALKKKLVEELDRCAPCSVAFTLCHARDSSAVALPAKRPTRWCE